MTKVKKIKMLFYAKKQAVVLGFVTGIIGVFLYNIFSKWFSGMMIDIVL